MTTYYPWQAKQWQFILSCWQEQKLPHALLLTGPKGLGKLTFAQAVAARLLCQTTSVTQQPACGTCQSCYWLAANSHPDLLILQPEADANVIKIEQVRELLEALQQTVQASSHQVVILAPAEAMNKAAANALLKALEEPLGPVVFLLISHQPGILFPTIRSRCQRLDFPVPPVATSLAWLQNKLPAEPQLAFLLAIADNIPLRAMAFAQAPQLAAHHRLLAQFMQLSTADLAPLEMAAVCMEMDGVVVFEGLYLLSMDILRIQQAPHSPIAHAHQLTALTAIAQQLSSTSVFYFLDQLMTIKNHLNQKIHLNMLLVWEALFTEWVMLSHSEKQVKFD